MKRKRNHSLRGSVFIFLAALFLLFTCSVSTIYASTLQKPDIAASGKFVKDGNYWIYRYDDKTIAKNIFLKIDKKTYYFNKLGHRWCSWHTIKGKNYYFGTRSQGYLIKNSLINIKEIITMSVKTVPWLPDGTLTNPERNTILAKTEKQLQENTRSRELTITLTRMVLSPTPD